LNQRAQALVYQGGAFLHPSDAPGFLQQVVVQIKRCSHVPALLSRMHYYTSFDSFYDARAERLKDFLLGAKAAHFLDLN
jgi:hypothetical protein